MKPNGTRLDHPVNPEHMLPWTSADMSYYYSGDDGGIKDIQDL